MGSSKAVLETAAVVQLDRAASLQWEGAAGGSCPPARLPACAPLCLLARLPDCRLPARPPVCLPHPASRSRPCLPVRLPASPGLTPPACLRCLQVCTTGCELCRIGCEQAKLRRAFREASSRSLAHRWVGPGAGGPVLGAGWGVGTHARVAHLAARWRGHHATMVRVVMAPPCIGRGQLCWGGTRLAKPWQQGQRRHLCCAFLPLHTCIPCAPTGGFPHAHAVCLLLQLLGAQASQWPCLWVLMLLH